MNLNQSLSENQWQELCQNCIGAYHTDLPKNRTLGAILDWLPTFFKNTENAFYNKLTDDTWYVGYEGTIIEGLGASQEEATFECALCYSRLIECHGNALCS